MLPHSVRPLFWDVNLDNFNPASHPEYAIGRVLEYGDEQAVAWMRETFSEDQVREVIRTERRLSRKSANFWALVFHIPFNEVVALQ